MTSLASVFVEVRPDTSGFSSELKTSLSKSREAVDVLAKLDTSKIKPQLEALKADLKAISVTKANISADTAQANAKLRALKAELKGLNGQVKLDADNAAAKAKVAAVKAEIASIGDRKANLSVDTAAASAHLKALSAQLALFDGKDVHVKADVDQAGLVGIRALTAGALALGPALAPLAAFTVGGLAALGPVLLAGGAAAGVAALAFHGVGDALKALVQQHAKAGQEATAQAKQEQTAAFSVAGAQDAMASARRTVARGAQTAASAVRAAQLGVTRAEQEGARASKAAALAVADARRGVARASESAAAGVQSALRQQEQAEETLASAQRAARDAQEALTEARESARRKLADYSLNVAQAAIDERTAQLDLVDAKQRLDKVTADPRATEESRQRAQIAYDEQVLHIKSLQVHNKQLRADAAEASKKGVKGSDEVVAARRRERDAGRQVHAAQQGLRDAAASVAKAHKDGARQIAEAQRQVTQALSAQAQTEIENQQRIGDAHKSVAKARASAADQAINGAASIKSAQRGLQAALANQASVTDQASASQQALNEKMAALTPAGRKFVRFLADLGPVLKPLQQDAAGGFLRGITSGIKSALPAMPNLRKAIRGISDALGDVAAGFGRAIGGPGGRAFIDFIGKTAPPIIRGFGKVLRSLGSGFADMSVAFLPVTKMIGGGLIKLADKFANFAANDGFRPLINYMLKNGPGIAATLGSIVEAVGRLVVAAIPIGTVVLNALGGLANVIKRLPLPVLTGVIGAVAGLVTAIYALNVGLRLSLLVQNAWGVALKIGAAASKVFAAGQRLVNAALTANPIGLVVVAIAALVGGFILAYKKSETFRRIVDGAMTGVKKAAQAVAGWFTDSFIPFFTKKIPAAFQTVLGWVKRNWPWILGALTGPIGLVTVYIVKHWDKITGAFKNAKDWVVGAFKASWDKVQDVLLAPVRAARDTFNNIFGPGGPIRSAFSKAVTGITTIWSKLRDAVSEPIAFIVNTVFNKGIVPFVNRIPFIPGELQTIGGFAGGGYTGSGGKYEPAGIVHRNEHVIRSESTTSLNRSAPGFLDHLNTHGAKALKGVLPGYWLGGGVKPAAGAVTQHSGYPWAKWAGDLNEPGDSDIGHPVRAWKAGVVAAVKHLTTSYGEHIRLNHAGNERTLYAHLSRIMVGVNQRVAQGQVIGLKGGTGNVTGPHLHFEIAGGSNPVMGGGRGSKGSGTGVSAFGGPTAAEARSSLNPAKWVSQLAAMGPWGGALGGVVNGVVGTLRNAVVGKLKGAASAVGSVFAPNGGSGGVSRFAPVVSGVLKMLGSPQSVLPDVMHRMMRESGGRPGIVNTTDSNWAAGHPSVGLMQVIRGTFDSYAGPYRNTGPFKYGVSTNPTANIYAGLNYAQHRYGSIAAGMNQPGGYDSGGIARGRGVMVKNTLSPERVLSPRQTDTYDRLLPLLEQLGAPSSRPINIHGITDPSAVAREVVRQESWAGVS